MTTKDEALKMALEALEFIRRWGEPEEGVLKRDEAITAIRAALASKSEALMSVPDGAQSRSDDEQPAQQQDLPDLIAGALGVSRGTAYDMMREALAQQQSAERGEPVACTDEMCACRGGPCVSCPDGEREKELADAWDSRDFYKRRTDELQKAQSQMRDPERTMVCDILANGRLLVPAGDRYDTSPPASPSQGDIKPWQGLTDEAVWSLYKNLWMFHPVEEPRLAGDILKFARAIEAKLKENNGF